MRIISQEPRFTLVRADRGESPYEVGRFSSVQLALAHAPQDAARLDTLTTYFVAESVDAVREYLRRAAPPPRRASSRLRKVASRRWGR
jgi:hypothetical protein